MDTHSTICSIIFFLDKYRNVVASCPEALIKLPAVAGKLFRVGDQLRAEFDPDELGQIRVYVTPAQIVGSSGHYFADSVMELQYFGFKLLVVHRVDV
jgi:hypothetical protein